MYVKETSFAAHVLSLCYTVGSNAFHWHCSDGVKSKKIKQTKNQKQT